MIYFWISIVNIFLFLKRNKFAESSTATNSSLIVFFFFFEFNNIYRQLEFVCLNGINNTNNKLVYSLFVQR